MTTHASSDSESEAKHGRETIEAVLSNLTCPITQEFPYDPVMAGDGHLYEREAIVEHFERSDKSPMTNLSIDKKLFPVRHARDILEVILGTNAKNTSKNAQFESRVEDWRVGELKRQMVANHEALKFIREWRKQPSRVQERRLAALAKAWATLQSGGIHTKDIISDQRIVRAFVRHSASCKNKDECVVCLLWKRTASSAVCGDGHV